MEELSEITQRIPLFNTKNELLVDDEGRMGISHECLNGISEKPFMVGSKLSGYKAMRHEGPLDPNQFSATGVHCTVCGAHGNIYTGVWSD